LKSRRVKEQPCARGARCVGESSEGGWLDIVHTAVLGIVMDAGFIGEPVQARCKVR